MKGNNSSKSCKKLQNSASNATETKTVDSENGKVTKKKAKLPTEINSQGKVNKKAAKLVGPIRERGPNENFIERKQKDEAPAVEKGKKIERSKQLSGKANKPNKTPKENNADGGNAEVPQAKIDPTRVSEADLRKIEKKKAKKAAQRLKKAQRKSMQRLETDEGTKVLITPVKKPEKKLKNSKKAASKVAENGYNKEETSVTILKTEDTTLATPVSDRVLFKKERKIKKRQLLKEQKLAEKSTRSPATEEATVFVGNLPVNTKRVQLVKLFEKYGPVNSIRIRSAGGKILHKHKMRKAAGSLNAYVVLQNKSAAEEAVELNGAEFKGNHLRVTKSAKISVTKVDSDETKRTVFVGNLKYSATEEALREIFTSCGEIEYIRCLRDGDKGCKGVAYVCFKHADGVGLALELKDTVLDERPIHVERYSVTKLGAKEQRDIQAAKEKAKQNNSKKVSKANKKPNKNQNSNDGEELKKSKKSEFRGVKVDGLKKKNKKKLKKSQASELAKRIAPKVST